MSGQGQAKMAVNLTQQNKSLLRRLEIIKILSLILLIASGLSFLSSLAQILFGNGGLLSLGFTILSLLIGLPFGVSYFLAHPSASQKRADVGALILTISLLIAIALAQFLEIGSGAIMASFLIVPVLAGLVGLARKSLLTIVLLSGILMVITYNIKPLVITSTQETSLTYSLQILVNWVVIYAIISGGIITFASRLAKSTNLAEEQTARLSDLLIALNSSVEFSTAMANDLGNVTADLNTAWSEHTGNTQQHVAAVTQVAAGLEELNETANQIANSASSASSSAGQVLAIASEVKDASELVQSAVIQGTQSVEQALTSVEQVRNRIELLGQKLLNLTEQTRRVGAIIDLIDEITDETHLLALNASIEAAGGVHHRENTGQVNLTNRGERFGVIAQEIKSLSDRSRESTDEVRQAITEMQGAVAAAVLVAEEGKKETAAALSRSKISGAVINKLNEVIGSSAAHAYIIVRAAEEVNIRCDEISLATGQQRSANQQILLSMRDVSQVSQESAKVVHILFQTVSRVNHQVEELTQVLTKSSQAVNYSGMTIQ